MDHAVENASTGTDRFVPVSSALRDTSLFHPQSGQECCTILRTVQDGVDLFYWAGNFKEGMELPLKDDSHRISLSYTTKLEGIASRSYAETPHTEHPVEAHCGSIEYSPDRSGFYRQKGRVENLTIMVRKEAFNTWVDVSDHELLSLSRNGGVIDGYRSQELSRVVQTLNHELQKSTQSETQQRHPLWFQAQALAIIGLFLECRSGQRTDDGVTADVRRRLLHAKDLLLSDLSAALPIPVLAKEAGMSAPSLTRGFHKLFGTSPYKLFQRERMHTAHARLSQSSASVTTVAIDLGYSNFSHFAKAFRNEFGILPGELRQT